MGPDVQVPSDVVLGVFDLKHRAACRTRECRPCLYMKPYHALAQRTGISMLAIMFGARLRGARERDVEIDGRAGRLQKDVHRKDGTTVAGGAVRAHVSHSSTRFLPLLLPLFAVHRSSLPVYRHGWCAASAGALVPLILAYLDVDLAVLYCCEGQNDGTGSPSASHAPSVRGEMRSVVVSHPIATAERGHGRSRGLLSVVRAGVSNLCLDDVGILKSTPKHA
jgi:hypothetical protein